MSDPRQSISYEINSAWNSFFSSDRAATEINFDTEIKDILYAIATIIEEDRALGSLISDLKDPLNGSRSPMWRLQLKNLSENVSRLSHENKKYRDKTEEIHENDKRAQWRTLGFRLLTTASLGLSLMILYSLAAGFDWLSMPLQMVK